MAVQLGRGSRYSLARVFKKYNQKGTIRAPRTQVMGFPAEIISVGEGGSTLWKALERGDLHIWPEVWRFEDGAPIY